MRPPSTIRARELRRDMSGTERRVWYRLRRKQVAGHRFRRQLPIGPYFADFVCLKARLVVEIDGAGHDDPERDQRKTAFLESAGFRVIRIPASVTDQRLDDVIATVFRELDRPLPAAAPPTTPASGEVKTI